MKTMEELFQEVLGRDELKGAFAQACKRGPDGGVPAGKPAVKPPPEEVKAFLQENADEGRESCPRRSWTPVSGGCSTIEASVTIHASGFCGRVRRYCVLRAVR